MVSICAVTGLPFTEKPVLTMIGGPFLPNVGVVSEPQKPGHGSEAVSGSEKRTA